MAKASRKVPKEVTRKHLARAEREARQQRWLFIGLGVTLLVVFGLVGYGVLYERVLIPQQPVASVNGVNITTAEFQKRVRFARSQINSQLSQLEAQRATFASDPQLSFLTQQIDQNISSLQSQLADPTTLGRQVLDSMIDDESVRQEAAKRNITVPSAEVQTNIEHSYNFYRVPPTPTAVPTASPTPLTSPTPEPTPTLSITPTSTPAPTGTPEPTATPVTEQAFNTQFNNFLSQISATGMTRADIYKLVESGLLRTKLEDEFNKTVPTSADQLQFRYIAFETEQAAQASEAQLEAGTSFDSLYASAQAGQVVSATASSEPWTPVSDVMQQFSPSVAQVLTTLSVSQTSSIITETTGTGALIVQLTGRGVEPLGPSQLQTAQQQNFQTWLDTQRNGPGVNLYNNRYLDRIPTS